MSSYREFWTLEILNSKEIVDKFTVKEAIYNHNIHSSSVVPNRMQLQQAKFIDDSTSDWLTIFLLVITLGIVTVLGSVGNIINIIIFIRQGFSDTVNISFLGLALADLGSLVTLLWLAICFNPLFRFSDIPFESTDVEYITAAWPHVCFARITSWITAFITFERCLCIALPMKVKHIITGRRTTGTIITIFAVMFISILPVYYAVRLDPVFYPERNATLIGLVYVEDGRDIENYSFSFSIFSQMIAFIIVVICTAILIRTLILKSKWRQTAVRQSTSDSTSTMSTRDKTVMKMVILISSIFIICLLPAAVNLIPMICFAPAYSILGQYSNLFKLNWSIIFVLETTNSSVNIFVYYRMSSKYRAEFLNIFGKRQLKTTSLISKPTAGVS